MAQKLLRRRWSLYIKYKTYSVDDSQLYIQPSLPADENYRNLFLLQKRIQKCLDARMEVHRMYADDDMGHKNAIAYTEAQLATANSLLNKVCLDIHHQMALLAQAALSSTSSSEEEDDRGGPIRKPPPQKDRSKKKKKQK